MLQKIGCILLLSLFTAQSITSHWVMDVERIGHELCDPVDTESEKEETKSEKEKDQKLREDLYAMKFTTSGSSINFMPPIDLQSTGHPEITTPPPRKLYS